MKGKTGPGFLASNHTVLEVELSGMTKRKKAEWVMDRDLVEEEVRKIKLL